MQKKPLHLAHIQHWSSYLKEEKKKKNHTRVHGFPHLESLGFGVGYIIVVVIVIITTI